MIEVNTQVGAGQRDGAAQRAAQKSARSPQLLIRVGIAAAGLSMIGLTACQYLPDIEPSVQDLGGVVSSTTGLKGTLKTRWQSTSAQYQLEIDPVYPLEDAGFAYVAANPPGPFTLHMKLLDAAGNAVCGKDVLFPFHATSRAEADREVGQDLLQTKVDNGKVVSMSAMGALPCTDAQYKQVVHWDFSTDFPMLAEQDRMVRQSADSRKKQETQKKMLLAQGNALLEGDAQGSAAPSAPPRSTFYIEGDERVTKYDPARNVIETKLGGSFQVAGSDQQATARLWGDNHVLFHYKCDQHSDCVLASAGDGQSLSATAVQ